MGGAMDCVSAPGVGTTIGIGCPRATSASAAAVPAPAPAPALPATGKRVLLVEDTEMNRLLASILLKKLDWEVDKADDDGALAALRHSTMTLCSWIA
jgi:hypothetical protein